MFLFLQHTDNILDNTNMSGGELQCSYGIIMFINDVSLNNRNECCEVLT